MHDGRDGKRAAKGQAINLVIYVVALQRAVAFSYARVAIGREVTVWAGRGRH